MKHSNSSFVAFTLFSSFVFVGLQACSNVKQALKNSSNASNSENEVEASSTEGILGRRGAENVVVQGMRGDSLPRAYNSGDPVGQLKKSTVAITYRNKVMCSGVAVSPNHILTVIDCFPGFVGDFIFAENSSGANSQIKGNLIQYSPLNNNEKYENLVSGMARLQILTVESLPAGTEHTEVHTAYGTIHAGHIVQVGGFGNWKPKESEAKLNFKEHTYCNPSALGDTDDFEADKLVIRTRGSYPSTCKRDAGGPIFSRTLGQWTVTGITIAREGCASTFSAAIDLRFHAKWIEEAIQYTKDNGLTAKTHLTFRRLKGEFTKKFGSSLGLELGNRVPLSLENHSWCPRSQTDLAKF